MKYKMHWLPFVQALLHAGEAAVVLESAKEITNPIIISPPHSTPKNASQSINPSFPGFAFEELSFYYYAGSKSNPNQVSQNLIQAITEKTQTRPVIRVGGTSLDHSSYHPDQERPFIVPGGQNGPGIPKNLKLGPSYFDSFANFPQAQYVVDIPLAKNNLRNSLLFAKEAHKAIGASNIYALEIGNEPNIYPGNARPTGWSQADYTTQWNNWSGNISKALGISTDSKTYQAIALSSETSAGFPGGTSGSWNVSYIFKHGMAKDKARIKSVSMHYYQTKANSTSNLQDDLMKHTAVVKGCNFVREAVQYLSTPDLQIPLVLGEVGNTLGNGSAGISLEGVLGSALWQVDFSLYSMFIGVSGINMQSGISFPFSLWHPQVNSKPGAVLPAFYGLIFAAEFISPHRNVSVANIDLEFPFLSAYAAYDDGVLARIAIVNLQLWSRSGNSTRPSRNITLDVGTNAKTATVKKLTSPDGGTATGEDNITWGGMRWTYEGKGVGAQVLNDTQVLPVRNGTVDLEVHASEAVMVFL